MSFKFDIYTLVDITNTGAKRNEDGFAYKQHQNFLTIQQTIGLRVNIIMESDPQIVDEYPNFGTDFDGEQKVWKVPVEIEYESALTIDMLNEDFQLVPFITGLTETAQFINAVFDPVDDKKRNIIFCVDDK
jgi:hypothetical protein